MFDDYLLKYTEPSFSSALKEYVEGGGYREDRGMPENVRFYLDRIEKYDFEILCVE